MTKEDQNFTDLLNEDTQENISFAESFADVKKLKQDKIISKTKLLDEDTAKTRQKAASEIVKKDTDEASSAFVHLVQPDEILSYKVPGAQPYMIRKLKNGEYLEADYIDLHGKTIEQAYEHTMNFIAHAKKEGFRCVLIIHGKGARSNPKAQMKSYVAHWLRQIPDVLAFHSSPEWKGGTGSLMIILKKSDKDSAINKEIYARGR